MLTILKTDRLINTLSFIVEKIKLYAFSTEMRVSFALHFSETVMEVFPNNGSLILQVHHFK